MNPVTLATTRADVDAVAAVEAHHAEMEGALTALVGRLTSAAATARPEADVARDELVAWCRRELLPHAQAEEDAMYPAGLDRDETRLLVQAMVAEHEVIGGLVDQLADAPDPVRAAAAATALATLFASHLRKENELLLPRLAAAPDVSVAALLDGMHELLGPDEDAPPVAGEGATEATDGHRCGCGGSDEGGDPELDARTIPHAIRHATVFGALDAVAPGHALVLVAPHDPLPLLGQVEQRAPGAFAVSYLEEGPEAWRVRFARRPVTTPAPAGA
jgi:uncharacterized protein (DUF2249 family)/iron-sulfur cluster repair protein YtfE (RIC family)